VTLFFAFPAIAQDVLLDIEVTMGGGEVRESQLELTFGEEANVPANSDYRLVVVPTLLESGRLRFTFKLYEPATSVEEPISSPIVEVVDGRQAKIAQGTEPPGPSTLAIQLTPHLQ
jgi:hypothetical protein